MDDVHTFDTDSLGERSSYSVVCRREGAGGEDGIR